MHHERLETRSSAGSRATSAGGARVCAQHHLARLEQLPHGSPLPLGQLAAERRHLRLESGASAPAFAPQLGARRRQLALDVADDGGAVRDGEAGVERRAEHRRQQPRLFTGAAVKGRSSRRAPRAAAAPGGRRARPGAACHLPLRSAAARPCCRRRRSRRPRRAPAGDSRGVSEGRETGGGGPRRRPARRAPPPAGSAPPPPSSCRCREARG